MFFCSFRILINLCCIKYFKIHIFHSYISYTTAPLTPIKIYGNTFLKVSIAKRDTADARVKQLEAKLKEEENLQIVSDVASYNLSPEQLAQFLQLANSGRLQDMLSGQAPMPAAATSGKETDAEEDNEQETGNEEEDFLDEENE